MHLRLPPLSPPPLLARPAAMLKLTGGVASRLPRSLPRTLLRAFGSQAEPPLPPDQPGAPAPPQAAGGYIPSVDPPAQRPWSADLVNSVSLTGTVLSQPTLYHTAGNQTVTNLLLGLRQRFGRHVDKQLVSLEAWGYTSLQLLQHVHPGMQIQVQGQLRESVWTDKATQQERRKLKVVVDQVHIIAPPAAHGSSGDAQHAEDAAAAGGLATAAAAAAAPRERSPPAGGLPGPAEAAHRLFQEGLSFQAIAELRGVKPSTAVENVVKAAGTGLPLDWARAASELQLGPQDSPWLTGDEVWGAIAAAHAEQFPGEAPTTRLMEVALKRVRDLLEAGAGTMAKLGAQESGDAGGKWVTYGQIKLVMIMALQGVDWNSVVLEPPVPLRAATGEPAAPPF